MSQPLPGRVVLVGAGKMGGALLQGWLAQGWGPQLTVVDPAPAATLQDGAARHGFALATGPAGLAPPAALVLAIKPQMLDGAAAVLQSLCGPETLLLSVLAGKTVADLAARLPTAAIVRAMPNTPAAVGRGITGAWANPSVRDSQRHLTAALLGAVGTVEWLTDEAAIDAVTAVSGSGPAYVFLLVEALAEAARSVGLAADQADRFARATVVGAGALMDADPAVPVADLRRNVTSPAGTTAAALGVLMDDGALAALMTRAVTAARDRARALAG